MSRQLRPAASHEHGQHIYAYCHLRTRQVLYSLTQTLSNAHSLKQLPETGANTKPAGLRKDVWKPLFTTTFPSAPQGLHALRKLSEYRKLHETSWTPPDALAEPYSEAEIEKLQSKLDERGGSKKESVYDIIKRKKKKLRLGIVMEQKANSVADLAAVLLEIDEEGVERKAEQAAERGVDKQREVVEILGLVAEAKEGGLQKAEAEMEEMAKIIGREEVEGEEEGLSKKQARRRLYALKRKKQLMLFSVDAVAEAQVERREQRAREKPESETTVEPNTQRALLASRLKERRRHATTLLEQASAHERELATFTSETATPDGKAMAMEKKAASLDKEIFLLQKAVQRKEEALAKPLEDDRRRDLLEALDQKKSRNDQVVPALKERAERLREEALSMRAGPVEDAADGLQAVRLREEMSARGEEAVRLREQADGARGEAEQLQTELEGLGDEAGAEVDAQEQAATETYQSNLVLLRRIDAAAAVELAARREEFAAREAERASKRQPDPSSSHTEQLNTPDPEPQQKNTIDYAHFLPPIPRSTNTSRLPKHGYLKNKLRRLAAPTFSSEGVKVQWNNILDAEFAETWPEGVEHEAMGLTRYTAPKPGVEGTLDVAEWKQLYGRGGKSGGKASRAMGRERRVELQGVAMGVVERVRAAMVERRRRTKVEAAVVPRSLSDTVPETSGVEDGLLLEDAKPSFDDDEGVERRV